MPFLSKGSALCWTCGSKASPSRKRTTADNMNHQRQPAHRAGESIPEPLRLPFGGPTVLACGGQLKNTICITRGAEAFLSPQAGDLQEFAAYDSFCNAIAGLMAQLGVKPAIVACDLHPEYRSTRHANALGIACVVPVQHHHAHVASCMAEHGLTEPVIGVAFDGSGYGSDGTVWGGEFLVADLREYRRIGHVKAYWLPGNEEAIRNPERMALSCLVQELGSDADAVSRLTPSFSAGERRMLIQMMQKGLNSPLASSVGRLFDAVSAMLGLCRRASYEGEAAIRLQSVADMRVAGQYPFAVEGWRGDYVLAFGDAIKAIVGDIESGLPPGAISAKFHRSVALGVVDLCRRVREDEGLAAVALSGGVFQNELLLGLVEDGLRASGFAVYSQHRVPPNDAGISLGQAAVALARQR
jgi:hydrogenase maturation protein HypF